MLKRSKIALTAIMIFVFFLAGFAGLPVEAKKNIESGKVIKGKGLSTVYYLGEDGKRYVFPNGKTYFSWFDDFENVEEIDMEDLTDYPLGGNVNYKPGAYLVKITTIPKVYAVSPGGQLRWVKTEELARQLYGEKWNLMVDDVPDSFFVNYEIGEAIDDADDYDPIIASTEAPEINNDLGLKARVKAQKRAMNKLQKRCEWLNRSIDSLQKRLNRWGMEVDGIGEDYLDQCIADNSDNPGYAGNSEKVELCHIPPGDPEAAETIIVGKAAAAAHLAHGDKLGPCGGDTGSSGEDGTTALEISDIAVDISETGAVISWTTNVLASGLVLYAEDPLDEDETTVTEEEGGNSTTTHSVELTGLTASTTYYFQVRSVDGSDNETTSEAQEFTTEDETIEDTIAPEISNVVVTPGEDSALIEWDTDELSDSLVEYAEASLGESGTTVLTQADEEDVISHSIEISGLSASTTYYFIIKSSDPSGNEAASEEDNFDTL